MAMLTPSLGCNVELQCAGWIAMLTPACVGAEQIVRRWIAMMAPAAGPVGLIDLLRLPAYSSVKCCIGRAFATRGVTFAKIRPHQASWPNKRAWPLMFITLFVRFFINFRHAVAW